MQKKIDKLIAVINSSGLKLQQKQYAFELVSDVVYKYNIMESCYQKRIRFDNEIKSDFYDYYDRTYVLLNLLGVSEYDIMSMNFKYYKWIKENTKCIIQQLTIYAINQMLFYLEMYENCYDGSLPEDLPAFKRFILEPLEINEETFEDAYKNALQEFKKTKIQPEIMRIGWFKQLCGKVKTSYIVNND